MPRAPPLCTASSTLKTTQSTWTSVCRPNSTKVNYFTLSAKTTHCIISYLFQHVFADFSPTVVTIRYQKTDGRYGTTSFNHPSLADGREHHVMLHASGLQRGPPRLNIYMDCRLAHTLNDLPAAFGSLPPGPNRVALRTLQPNGQVNRRFPYWIFVQYIINIFCIKTFDLINLYHSNQIHPLNSFFPL